MSAVNNFELVGRVVRDPQEFPRQNGAKSVLFTLAVNRGTKDQNGKDVADFIEISGYAKAGSKVYDYVNARDLIAVSGHLRSYKDKENHTQVAFQADNIEFLAKYKNSKTAQPEPEVDQSEPEPDMYDQSAYDQVMDDVPMF